MTSSQGEEVPEPVVLARPKGRAAGVPGGKALRGTVDVACPIFGHLSFDALGRLEKMVRGLPHIKHGGELCDS